MYLPIVVLLMAVVGMTDAAPDRYEEAFVNFVARFHKQYANEAERSERFLKFKHNLIFIEESNSMDKTYRLGVNEFSDLSPNEFAETHFGVKQTRLRGAWGDLPYLGSHTYSGKTLQDAVDWNANGAVTPVKNQGQCGSCWSFSTTGALEGAWQIATKSLVSLSEEQFVECSKENHACNGGSMDAAFGFAEKNSICTEESYPYTSGGGSVGACNPGGCTVGIPVHGVVGFKDVDSDNEQDMMSAVAQQPVSIAVEADKSVFQSYRSGVLSGACGSQLDHGILCTGYGVETDGTKYWWIKNSWGAVWGLNGFGKLLRGKGGSGECGILSQASYPVVNGDAPPAPSPPPSPTPPPAPPSSGHYEAPPCQQDEQALSIQGLSGDFCSPQCDAEGNCPTDVPKGTTATPSCALRTSTGEQFCALLCNQGGCPSGASCEDAGGAGICLYPAQRVNLTRISATFKQTDITV